jgi:hypothetical protein
MRSPRFLALATFALGTAALPAGACNVPVFRYALERWPADPYLLSLVHRGPLAEEAKVLADALEKTADDGFANLAVRRIDLADPAAAKARDLPGDLRDAELPCIVLHDPVQPGADGIVWKGPLSATNIHLLCDSPARQALRKRLLGGDSAVWLLLEGGDRTADDAMETLLDAQSKRMATLFEIPEMDPSDPRTRVNAELKIAFSTLRLRRGAPGEDLLLEQLFHMFPDLRETLTPMVFPVFGRGRVLCKLPGDELDADTLEEVAAFLTGACSCEVKAMNPGHDLMMAADWDALLEERVVEEPEFPPLVSLAGLAEQAAMHTVADAGGTTAAPVAATGPGSSESGGGGAATATAVRPSSIRRNLLLVGAAGLVILAAGTAWITRRRPPS